jgi:CRP/FNR family transcriptional regulator
MPELTKQQLISDLPYLRGLDPALAKSVADRSQKVELAAGEVLFTIGEPCLGMYVLSSGAIKVTRISPQGREQVMTLVRPGETLNDVPVFDHGACPATAIAVEDTTAFLVPAAAMRDLVSTRPEVAARTLQVLAARLRGLVNLVADLTHLDVPTRVARALASYSQQSPSKELSVNQSDLAAIVGTTREGVARALKRLEDEGAVTRRRGTIVVVDEGALRSIGGM